MDNKTAMSEFLEEARSTLFEIKQFQELHNQHLQMYKDLTDKRMEIAEKAADMRWINIRNMLIGLIGVFLLSFISDKIALMDRPTNEEIKQEYTNTERLLRGFGCVVDDNYDTMELKGDLTHEEANRLRIEAKKNILREIDPDYRERSPEEIK